MPYTQLFYHIITATKERTPLLTPEVEQQIYRFVKSKVYELEGDLYAVNGTVDHIHLVVSIPPKIALAEFIRQVKGFSAAQFNKEHPNPEPFGWQTEYGVFTFDKKRLPNYIDYVKHQKEHHQQGTSIPVLERWGEDGKQTSESSANYDASLDLNDLP